VTGDEGSDIRTVTSVSAEAPNDSRNPSPVAIENATGNGIVMLISGCAPLSLWLRHQFTARLHDQSAQELMLDVRTLVRYTHEADGASPFHDVEFPGSKIIFAIVVSFMITF